MMLSFGFDRSLRLIKPAQFELVYSNGKAMHHGPVKVHTLANECSHHRLGLSVPRRAGNAVRRNRYKRLLRDAFRHLPEATGSGYDLVITIRAHQPYSPGRYQEILQEAINRMRQP
ncbi:MAG: ribonuclease P protein component [Phycisphaerales bacterium]|nr:ribonuclease P protein component [Phycisphaerales bacterium]